MTDRNRWDEERRWRADNNYRSDNHRDWQRGQSGERQSSQQDWSSERDQGQGTGYPFVGSDRNRGRGGYDDRTEYQTSQQRYAGTGYSHYGNSPSSPTGDYFGTGDYGSGASAWDRGSQQSYAGSGRYGSLNQPSGLTGEYGSSGTYAPGSYDRDNNRQSYQRDSRSWGDRQQGGYGGERGLWDRASDEVMSWFGDEDAARRREQDHRGHGPADYTRSDDRIREDANDRLTEDPRVDARNISVSVSDGELTLGGTVASRDAKHRAEDCVENISGVKHVQNNLRVEPSRTGDASTASWNRDSAAAGTTTTSGTAGATTRTGTATTGTTTS